MQRIEIKNFGPIPYCNLELKDFMIFIGQQSTGKSTICKCIYFFKSVRDKVTTYMHKILSYGLNKDNEFVEYLNRSLKEELIGIFGEIIFKSDFKLRFDYDEGLFLKISHTKDSNQYLNITISKKMLQKIKKVELQVNDDYQVLKSLNGKNDLFERLEKDKAFKAMEFEVNKAFNDNREIYYIPAGRGLLTLLTNYKTLKVELLDHISRVFINIVEDARPNFVEVMGEIVESMESIDGGKLRNKSDSLKKLVSSLLKGEYVYRNGEEYIKLENSLLLPVNYASSGQQEVLWILNLLFRWMLRNSKSIFVVIEEPEAHLFTDAQKEIMDFIALFVNSKDNQVLITTHSPYILTSANNLLYAGKVGIKTDEVNKIIPKEKWIDPANFGVFMVDDKDNDYVRSIIDDELQEIAAEKIDRISKKIRSDYANIYNLEAENEF